MSIFVNASPQLVALGIRDDSVRTQLPEAASLPTHIPKVYGFFQKGPTTPQLVSGDARLAMYGADSFDELSPYFTHSTRVSNIANAQGNAHIIERVVPADAGPRANIQLWAEVVDKPIKQYLRNLDGSIRVDSNGDKMPDPEKEDVPGYVLRFVTTSVADIEDEADFGTLTISAGEQATSMRYPIAELRASSYGQWANLSGIRIWPATSSEVSGKYMQANAFPFNFAVVTKASSVTTAKPKATLLGDPSVLFTLKAGFNDPETGSNLHLSKVIEQYRNLSDLSQPINLGDFGEIFVYQQQIDILMRLLFIRERTVVSAAHAGALDTSLTDIPSKVVTGETTVQLDALVKQFSYLMNPFTAKTINGVPYYGIQIDNSLPGSVRMASNSDVMAVGGSDGTMDLDTLDAYVIERMSDYIDPNNQVSDNALHPETFIYDSGFGLQAKYAIMNFIGMRKDTNVVLTTFQAAEGKVLSNSEELSLAIALKSRLNFMPESSWFGTSVVRGNVTVGTGILADSNIDALAPLNLQILDFNSRLMGASNGNWKPENIYDIWPTNEVKLFKSVSKRFVPSTLRNKLWDAGVTWAQAYNLTQNFFPAIRSVYENDTSVLTSHVTASACAALETVGSQIWREFTGSINLTPSQFVLRVNKRVEQLVNGKFAGLYVVVPDCQITAGDAVRGYSWTLDIALYANNMKTAMRLAIHAKRMTDLA